MIWSAPKLFPHTLACGTGWQDAKREGAVVQGDGQAMVEGKEHRSQHSAGIVFSLAERPELFAVDDSIGRL